MSSTPAIGERMVCRSSVPGRCRWPTPPPSPATWLLRSLGAAAGASALELRLGRSQLQLGLFKASSASAISASATLPLWCSGRRRSTAAWAAEIAGPVPARRPGGDFCWSSGRGEDSNKCNAATWAFAAAFFSSRFARARAGFNWTIGWPARTVVPGCASNSTTCPSTAAVRAATLPGSGSQWPRPETDSTITRCSAAAVRTVTGPFSASVFSSPAVAFPMSAPQAPTRSKPSSSSRKFMKSARRLAGATKAPLTIIAQPRASRSITALRLPGHPGRPPANLRLLVFMCRTKGNRGGKTFGVAERLPRRAMWTSRWQSQQCRSPAAWLAAATSAITCRWQRRQLSSTTGIAPRERRITCGSRRRVNTVACHSPSLALKPYWPQQPVVRHVAVVAGGNQRVAAVLPGEVLRGHDVAIHARFRPVAEVGGGAGDVEDQQGHARRHSQQQEHRYAEPRGQQPQPGQRSNGVPQPAPHAVIVPGNGGWSRVLPTRAVGPIKKEGHLETASKRPFVEAAGIEPASRDISVQASTCIVG